MKPQQKKTIRNDEKMTKQEILERIKNVINQYPGEMIGDLDLLRHDLENDIIEEKNND